MLKALEKPKSTALTIKLSVDDLRMFKKMAHKYTDSNVSALVRHAVLNFKPNKDEMAE